MDATFEDVTVGEVREFGSYRVTREEILSFARKYDPQPFHTDPDAARESMFGELVASGWHTGAMTMRLLVDNYLNDSGAMGSPGIESLRWTEPVVAGDELSVRMETAEKSVWDDSRGAVRFDLTTRNQDGEPVMTLESLALFPRS